MSKPDKEYWRDIYEGEFQAGRDRQEYVLEVFSKRFPKKSFPDLKIKETGFGAKTAKRIKLREHERGEPDKTVYYKGKAVCYIEVSGSDIQMTPDKEIWIRPDKFDHAKQKDEEVWFYMVYKNGDFLLDREAIEPYQDQVKTVYLKGPDIPERYISIPSTKAHSRKTFFDWLEEQIT